MRENDPLQCHNSRENAARRIANWQIRQPRPPLLRLDFDPTGRSTEQAMLLESKAPISLGRDLTTTCIDLGRGEVLMF